MRGHRAGRGCGREDGPDAVPETTAGPPSGERCPTAPMVHPVGDGIRGGGASWLGVGDGPRDRVPPVGLEPESRHTVGMGFARNARNTRNLWHLEGSRPLQVAVDTRRIWVCGSRGQSSLPNV